MAKITSLADASAVDSRIEEMAAEVVAKYRGQDPLFICFLKGGMPFAAKLMFAIAQIDPGFHPQLDYMIVSTYGEGTEAREPRIVADLAPDARVKDRVVIMLDDVLDTGVTAAFVDKYLKAKEAAIVDLIVLVQKANKRSAYPEASMHGFASPAKLWLTGMGMDDAPKGPEINRWSNDIKIVN